MRSRESWDTYNAKLDTGSYGVTINKTLLDGKKEVETRKSYTHCFFEDHKFSKSTGYSGVI